MRYTTYRHVYEVPITYISRMSQKLCQNIISPPTHFSINDLTQVCLLLTPYKYISRILHNVSRPKKRNGCIQDHSFFCIVKVIKRKHGQAENYFLVLSTSGDSNSLYALSILNGKFALLRSRSKINQL